MTVDGKITGQYDGTNTIYFRYDSNNSLIGFNLNDTEYIYLKNIQGDIEGILDLDGNLVVKYTYDAWGKLLSITDTSNINLGTINPMRYRGYYYDNETGYYYLQSRYYNSEICRFINADEAGYIDANQTSLSYNLFAYCNNNPLNDSDPTGHLSLNSALAKITELLNKAVNKLTSYLKSLIIYKNGYLKISTTLIAATIDAMIAMLVNRLVYSGLKNGMKILLYNKSVRNSFVGEMFKFFLNNKAGKLVLRTIVQIGFMVAGKKGAVGTVVDAVLKDFLANIAFLKSKILQKSSSLISAFCSVGGIVALFVDLMDKKWDNYASLRIK